MVKLDPRHGQLLRAHRPSVRAGYPMSNGRWNTVTLGRRVLGEELAVWVDESYSLVVPPLPRKVRVALRLSASTLLDSRRAC